MTSGQSVDRRSRRFLASPVGVRRTRRAPPALQGVVRQGAAAPTRMPAIGGRRVPSATHLRGSVPHRAVAHGGHRSAAPDCEALALASAHRDLCYEIPLPSRLRGRPAQPGADLSPPPQNIHQNTMILNVYNRWIVKPGENSHLDYHAYFYHLYYFHF